MPHFPAALHNHFTGVAVVLVPCECSQMTPVCLKPAAPLCLQLVCFKGPCSHELLSCLQRLLNQWKTKVMGEYDTSKSVLRESIKAGCVVGESQLQCTSLHLHVAAQVAGNSSMHRIHHLQPAVQ